MSHELEIGQDGQARMFYVGKETPWHGLGKQLHNPPTTKEAIIAAGLNWRVDRARCFIKIDGIEEEVPARATVRVNEDGTHSVLGIVGPKYRQLQNEDAFEFFDPFVQSGLATMETAGSLSDGKRVWILAKLKGADISIVGDDVVQKYVLLSNSHDGSSPVKLGFTPIRVVCSNTLAAAHADKLSKLLRIRHTGNVTDNLSIIQNALNVVDEKFETTIEGYRLLARKVVHKGDLEKYVTILFGENKTEGEEQKVNTKRVERVTELFETGIGNDLKKVEGTWWAAYNGITQYLSYENGRTDDSRLNSLWFGEASAVNSQALNLALEMAV